ncbi:MAG TPA: general secretion pathway protein GspB [Rudaea sp.]|nr:general secretion pathway protein GspB [Rudaea sp.]
MSLILEALKKSEAKRRLGAAPDLGTPFAARRRRSPIVPIVVVVLAAAALAWWAIRRPTSEAPAQTAATQNAQRPPPTVPPPAAGQRSGMPLRSVTGDNNLEHAPPPTNLAKPATANGSPDPFVPMPSANANTDPTLRGSIKETRDRRRANANRGENPPPSAGAGRPMSPTAQPAAPPRNSAAVAAAPPHPTPAMPAPPTTAATPPPRAVAPVASASAQQSSPAIATPAPKAVAANPPAEQVATRAPKTPGTIGIPVNPPSAQQNASAKPAPNVSAQPYSELPFSVRKALPELRLSMHVYASDPAQRFVILNDSRIGEGDKTNDDVFVREIRPDGVVLEFQSQRFFYPRDGL